MAKQFAIFYIDANKAYFYGSNIATMLQVTMPADTMSYFDILNKDKFYQTIQALVTTNKIEPVPLFIVIAPQATYEKDLVGKTVDEINTETQQFLDTVPFDKVLSKTYKVQNVTKIVATNKDLYEYVRHGFEKMQFTTSAAVSLSLLQKAMPEIGTSLNFDVIATKLDAVKQYSFVTHEEINNPGSPSQSVEESSKPNPLRLYGLIGVFVVLIGILVFMVITTLQPQPKPLTKKVSPPLPVVVTSPTIVSSPTPINEGTSSGRIVISTTPVVKK